jgi:septum formation protein
MELTHQIILASASPRRSELMKALGFDFIVRATDAEEVLPDDLPHEASAEYLANLKADAAQDWLSPKHLTLTADSVVLLGDEWLGKPADAAEAIETLTKLCGNTHTVITGFCIQHLNEEGVHLRHSESVETQVTLGEASRAEIEHYVATQPPLDRAGSYGIQDWIGWAKVLRIEGSYSNVMGLPTAEVYEALSAFKA